MAKKKKGLAGILKSLLIIAAIVITAIVTCPDENAHKQAVKEAIRNEYIKEGKPFGGIVGSLATATVISENCTVFSLGAISIPGSEPQIVSVGVFGKVFIIR